jgi:hypothetical protein
LPVVAVAHFPTGKRSKTNEGPFLLQGMALRMYGVPMVKAPLPVQAALMMASGRNG